MMMAFKVIISPDSQQPMLIMAFHMALVPYEPIWRREVTAPSLFPPFSTNTAWGQGKLW